MNTSSSGLHLLEQSREQWQKWLTEQGASAAHATTLLQQIHRHGEWRPEAMKNVPSHVQAALSKTAKWQLPDVVETHHAQDGTCKWLLRLTCGNIIETVLIPSATRNTLCVSSQAGCALGCTFCRTARSGFSRNLAAHEILAQIWLVRHQLQQQTPVTNLVFMGMGEPLANLDAVLAALRVLQDDHAYALGHRRITVSTAGLVPQIERLHKHANVSLAVSLHAADDALRTRLMPINARYPIDALLSACRRYVGAHSRKRTVTIEYALLAGINDSLAQARRLAERLQGLPSKVNLIPFNPFPGSGFAPSSEKVQRRFGEALTQAGIVTLTRRPRGDDIAAACGQLAGVVRPRFAVPRLAGGVA